MEAISRKNKSDIELEKIEQGIEQEIEFLFNREFKDLSIVNADNLHSKVWSLILTYNKFVKEA